MTGGVNGSYFVTVPNGQAGSLERIRKFIKGCHDDGYAQTMENSDLVCDLQTDTAVMKRSRVPIAITVMIISLLVSLIFEPIWGFILLLTFAFTAAKQSENQPLFLGSAFLTVLFAVWTAVRLFANQ